MRRKRVPWLENGASRSASRCQRPSDPGSPRVLSSGGRVSAPHLDICSVNYSQMILGY